MPINQMLVTVTRPIEEACNTVQGLDRVYSITSRGDAEINLFFEWNIDMNLTLQRVNAALASIQNSLPSTVTIKANRMTFAAFPIMGYSLTSETVPQTDLWEFANYIMKPRLNRTKGVSTVVVQADQIPEFQVQPDPSKLVRAAVTVPDILDAIGRSNLIDSPGLIEANHELILSLVTGQVKTPAEISDIVVKTTAAGAPVRIGDIATIGPSIEPKYTIVTANRKPAVLININRQPDANTVEVANGVHAQIAELQKALPRGVDLRSFYDQSDLVAASIASVRDAVLIGLLLASLIMVIFLRDWGTSLVAGLVIPATIAVTFIALKAAHENFDMMTLGGLAAAVGLVIDDAIVVVENIVTHRDAGQSRSQAIRSALDEIRVPLVGSTITPIVVFIPLIAIAGVTGVFFRALAFTVGAALLTSLALALTWTPTLSHYFIRQRRGGAAAESSVPPRLMRVYERVLRGALERPVLLALGGLVVVAGSYFCFNAIGSDLLPTLDEGGFVLDYITPAGASLAETNRMISHIESILAHDPEVETTSRRTGMELGLAAVTEANRGDISVRLKTNRKHTTEEVMDEVREKVTKAEPVVDVELVQKLEDEIGDLSNEPEPIAIKLFCEDPDVLRDWATRVGDAVKKIPGVVDVLDGIENTISGPASVFQVDPVASARAGFTPEEIEQDASAILQGEPAPTPVVINDHVYTIRVRFPARTRATLADIRNTLLISGSGKTATIGSLASFTDLPGQTEIRRDNLQRLVTVTGRLEGVNLGEGIRRVKQTLTDLNMPPSIRVEFGGGYQEQQKSFKDLAFVLVLAIVLVFIVLLFEFANFAAPVAVLCSALLSTCGVFGGLLVTGKDLQPGVLHGVDYGDRHRGEERHSAAGRRPEVPGGRTFARRGHDSRG